MMKSDVPPELDRLLDELCEAAMSYGYLREEGGARQEVLSKAAMKKARAMVIEYFHTLTSGT